MSSLPMFSLNDLDEPESRPSNLSLHNKLLTEEIALDARQIKRSSGSLVIQNVSNYGLISELVTNKLIRAT